MKTLAFLAVLALCFLSLATRAQSVLPQPSDGGGKGVDTKKIYTVVEQMPTLPTGGGQGAITAAVQQAVAVPAGEPAEGRVFVEFVVDRSGKVRNAKVLKSPSPALGKAVLAAVAKLPRLKPGMQNGETTNVRLTIPVSFPIKP